MESEILHQLNLIREYIFVIMLAMVFWALFKLLSSSVNIFTVFKTAWDTSFQNKMENLMDAGEYINIIKSCKEKLEDYPNHANANWFIAKAYFYTDDRERSKKHFDKVIYLMPAWDESVNSYLDKMNDND